MSGPGDDPMLDDYLKRGTAVSRRYREIETDGVPPELDRRVLDQARAAVSKPRSWMRWSAPIALAASTVLVVSIVIETGVDKDAVLDEADVPLTASEAPSAEPAAPAPAEVAAPPSTAEVAANAADSARADAASRSSVQSDVLEERAAYGARRRAPVIPGEAPEPVMIVPVPQAKREVASPPAAAVPMESPAVTAQSPAEAKEVQAKEVQAREAQEIVVTGASSGPTRQRGSSAPAAMSVQSRDEVEAARSDAQGDVPSDKASGALEERSQALPNPEAWLKQIRKLRREGKAAEADREWSRFREAFPDYPVAEADAARKPDSR